MFDSVTEISRTQGIKIGRITFAVVASFPLLLLFHLVFSPGVTKEDRLGDSLLSVVMLAMSLILTIVGSAILGRVWWKGLPKAFWLVALFFAALPLLFGTVSILAQIVASH